MERQSVCVCEMNDSSTHACFLLMEGDLDLL